MPGLPLPPGFQQQRRHEMATQVEETTPEQLRNMLRK